MKKLLLILLVSFLLIACGKEDGPAAHASLVGKWKGTHTEYTYYEPDGTVITQYSGKPEAGPVYWKFYSDGVFAWNDNEETEDGQEYERVGDVVYLTDKYYDSVKDTMYVQADTAHIRKLTATELVLYIKQKNMYIELDDGPHSGLTMEGTMDFARVE